MNLKNELHKVLTEIKRHGERYEFFRNVTNEDGEPIDKITKVDSVNGLFHISKGFIVDNTMDGAKVHSKGQPMMLLKWEDSLSLKNGDFVIIHGQRYNLIEKNNIQEYSIACDLSLEVVLDGNN